MYEKHMKTCTGSSCQKMYMVEFRCSSSKLSLMQRIALSYMLTIGKLAVAKAKM